jgi:galactokinase
MMTATASLESTDRLTQNLQAALADHSADGSVAISKAPAVLDVMGGIGEDSGALVLTTTLGLSFTIAMWPIAVSQLRVHFSAEGGESSIRQFFCPIARIFETDARSLVNDCRAEAEWVTPIVLALRHTFTSGAVPKPASGLMCFVQTDFPPDADLGRTAVMAVTAIDALCKLTGAPLDSIKKSKLACDGVMDLTGMPCMRTALTALSGRADGSLLQIQFHPQFKVESLALPPGISVVAARTQLARPTTHDRILETRTCTAMSQRMINDLRQRDGVAASTPLSVLAAISPTEYTETIRDRIPSKISGKAFVAKFGELRGLNGTLVPDETYKIRSRAEHHIYENKRVNEFVSAIVRARRSMSIDVLKAAGELMYASHWSHSQRCGIGGVETDRIVSAIRKQGPAMGLFGAKVTGGGAGGELVVLMRDDDASRNALAAAIREVQTASSKAIHTFRGNLPGADFFVPPSMPALA